MSRPFAMWIERAYESRVRGHLFHLTGPILGRAPDIGDALLLHGLFDTIPMRCRQFVGESRGGDRSMFTLGVDPIEVQPARLRGAFLVEDGVVCRRFGTLLRQRRPPSRTTARFELRDGHAWGLVSIRSDTLNVVVVGGGLGSDVLWSVLKEIRLESGERLTPSDLNALAPGEGFRWMLRAAKSYVRDDDSRAFVLPAVGPVWGASMHRVWVERSERSSCLIQQPNGVTQFVVRDAAMTNTEMLGIDWHEAA